MAEKKEPADRPPLAPAKSVTPATVTKPKGTSPADGQELTARRPGFWTFQTLVDRNANEVSASRPSIISDFDPENPARRERASYNLRVGAEIYISPPSSDEINTREILKPRESRVIPPGQFALLQSEEIVTIPDDAIAFITLRSKAAKFRGLVNVSGFSVEPGYSGNLVFAVFNAGPGSIQVARGDEWFEIFFADLDGATEQVRKKLCYDGIPNELITPLSDRFHSLPGLAEKIEDTRDELDERLRKIEQEHSILRWSLALILGVLIAVGARNCSSLPQWVEPAATVEAKS